MTQQEAKDLSLEVWEYFRDHPKLYDKDQLPPILFYRLKNLYKLCPLCELFFENTGYACPKCPLGYCTAGSLYCSWDTADTEEDRSYWAGKIVEALEAWTPSIS